MKEQGERKKSWLHRHIATILLILLLVAGVGIMTYPTIANWWNSMHQSRAVMDYQGSVSKLTQKQYQRLLRNARAYNTRLAQTGILWRMTAAEKKEYQSLLNIDGTGMMGYIRIPEIKIELPVYHGTDDAVLQTSIGHIAGTSLPIGGISAHSILSGHRGLPSSRLFTDLDKMKQGDTFTITVLNKTVTYEVDQIKTVLPDDLTSLQIENGRDYCTLETCTPYGINTHRLLVRGHRVPNADGDANVLAEAIQIRPAYMVPFVIVPFAVLLSLYLWISGKRNKKKILAVKEYLRTHELESWIGAATTGKFRSGTGRACL